MLGDGGDGLRYGGGGENRLDETSELLELLLVGEGGPGLLYGGGGL